MQKIAVISDSSCDYSPEQALAAGFTMVPLIVSFGEESFLEGLELTPAQFYRRLAKAHALPKTSQPSPEMFLRVMQSYPDAEHIVCVTIAGGLSGTVRSARLAADLLEEQGFAPKIHVVDSMNGCAATGLMAETAARMAREGADIEAILQRMEQMQRTAAIYFVPETLEYLRRGGRIGSVRAAVGGLLGVKPMLTVVRGQATDAGKCRGAAQIKHKLVQKFLETARDLHEVLVVHSDVPEQAHALVQELRHAVPGIRARIHSVGAVIGTYIGAGAIGLAFEEKAPRWEGI